MAASALATGALAACGAQPELSLGSAATTVTTVASAPTTAVPATPPGPATTSTLPPAPPGTGPVTIAFGGDVHGEPPISGVLAAGGNPLESVSGPLSSADLAVVNLETAVGTLGRAADKEFVFQAPSSLLDAMHAAGVDVVSVANNHSFDMGTEAFFETIDNVRAADMTPVGGGRTEAEAYAPAIVDVDGTTVAVIGLAKIGPDEDQRAVGDRPGTTNGRDRTRTVAAVSAARAAAPVVIVFVHWGDELAECPRDDDIALASALLDAGASAVIGMHPHVLQGITERPDGKVVAWSIGNLAFYAKREEARQTGVFTLTIEGDGTVSAVDIAPARIDGDGRPRLAEGSDADAIRQRIADLTPGAGTCAAIA